MKFLHACFLVLCLAAAPAWADVIFTDPLTITGTGSADTTVSNEVTFTGYNYDLFENTFFGGRFASGSLIFNDGGVNPLHAFVPAGSLLTLSWDASSFYDALGFPTGTVFMFHHAEFTLETVDGPILLIGDGSGATFLGSTSFTTLADTTVTGWSALYTTGADGSGSNALSLIGNLNELQFTIVPEPGSAAILALGAAACLLRRRRRA